MTLQSHGSIPVPDHRRIHRATEPRLRHPIPALLNPVENANVILNKQVLTLHRGGSNPGNPILSGLGGRVEFHLGSGDSLRGIFLYQDRADLGPNLKAQASLIAPGAYAFDFVAGSGQTRAGSPATGARKNFIRIQSARGAFEKTFWIKTKDADIVALEGQPALDPDTLDPVPCVVEIVDPSRTWLDVTIDFMPSWNDEFQKLHNAGNPYLDPGFLKAYGGARWVSFFDTSTATEGLGVQVNPVTQADIRTRHKIQVQNTVGLKEITVRFRAKKDSLAFVDVQIQIEVIDQVVTACYPPAILGCTEVYLKKGTACPVECPSEPSTPGVQVEAGTPGIPLAQDLLVVTVRGAMVGGIPKLRVRKWKYVESAPDLSGARTEQVGSDLDFLPLALSSTAPVMGSPYNNPQRYTIAFGVQALRNDLVAFITVTVLDDTLQSQPILVVAAMAREVCWYPAGETGGGAICGY